jgi:hypothetical protein
VPRSTVCAAACGYCGDVSRCDATPTACFKCGARFDRDAPLGLLSLDVDVGPDFQIQAVHRVELRGTWDTAVAAEARRALLELADG